MRRARLLRLMTPELRIWIPAGVLLLLLVSPTTAQAPDAAAHRQWMNDASDAQEDYRAAVAGRDQKAAIEALGKLESLMGRTEDYWTARKASDAVTLARQARAFAARALAAAKADDLSAAAEPFDRMGASCNACHELHLEKR